jgi:adenylosuccinate lyase
MIERYTRPEMGKIWEPKRRFETWLAIEIAACEAWQDLGRIPQNDLDVIKLIENHKFTDSDIKEIADIEEVTKHDVISFVTFMQKRVEASSARFIHMGLTSSDILDTSLALLLVEAADLIISDIERLLPVLKRRAFEFKETIMVGRTHGIHAEPITFGHKLAVWYEETKRNCERMREARKTIAVGKISGAVGTFANLDPRVEEIVLKRLGLVPEPASTQIVQRDRHAQFFTTLAVIASSVEKFALEIRHLQRTEVAEAQEYFSPGQKGSSAMPHKRNPILSENIDGLARIVRANAVAALENVALWHERDISHSSVERVITPDSTILLDFMLARFTNLIDKLVVYPERMKKNLEATGGLIYSQRLMTELISTTGMLITRDDIYEHVQSIAKNAFETETSFIQLVKQDETILKYLTPKRIEEIFDPDWYVRYTDFIFGRVFS